jgi:hypothetical protein
MKNVIKSFLEVWMLYDELILKVALPYCWRLLEQ